MRSGYESELSLIFGGEDIKMDRILFLLERIHQYDEKSILDENEIYGLRNDNSHNTINSCTLFLSY